jgi:hypothetical protein
VTAVIQPGGSVKDEMSSRWCSPAFAASATKDPMASRTEPRRISGRYIVDFLVVFAVLCAASRQADGLTVRPKAAS